MAPPPSQPPPKAMYTAEMQDRLNQVWNQNLDKGAVTADLATMGVR